LGYREPLHELCFEALSERSNSLNVNCIVGSPHRDKPRLVAKGRSQPGRTERPAAGHSGDLVTIILPAYSARTMSHYPGEERTVTVDFPAGHDKQAMDI
jgi:hypothetical protein